MVINRLAVRGERGRRRRHNRIGRSSWRSRSSRVVVVASADVVKNSRPDWSDNVNESINVSK